MTRARTDRLTRARWIEAGFAALAEDGHGALKAEPLARRLGTTKGSFYWHFRDVPEFQSALLAAWEQQSGPPDPRDANPAAGLRALAQRMARPDPLERALRAWSLSDDRAAAALARHDTNRQSRIAALLAAMGVANPDMARLIGAATTGLAMQGGTADDNDDTIGSLVDLILLLR